MKMPEVKLSYFAHIFRDYTSNFTKEKESKEIVEFVNFESNDVLHLDDNNTIILIQRDNEVLMNHLTASKILAICFVTLDEFNEEFKKSLFQIKCCK